MRPRRAVIVMAVVVFTVAAVFLLYEGLTTGDWLLVVGVVVAYTFMLGLEARLSLRQPEPAAKAKPAKKTSR